MKKFSNQGVVIYRTGNSVIMNSESWTQNNFEIPYGFRPNCSCHSVCLLKDESTNLTSQGIIWIKTNGAINLYNATWTNISTLPFIADASWITNDD